MQRRQCKPFVAYRDNAVFSSRARNEKSVSSFLLSFLNAVLPVVYRNLRKGITRELVYQNFTFLWVKQPKKAISLLPDMRFFLVALLVLLTFIGLSTARVFNDAAIYEIDVS